MTGEHAALLEGDVTALHQEALVDLEETSGAVGALVDEFGRQIVAVERAVELGVLVVQPRARRRDALLARAERAEVLAGLRASVRKELEPLLLT